MNLAGLSERFSASLTRTLLACAAPIPACYQPRDQQATATPTAMWSSYACGGYVSEEAALHLIYRIGSTHDQFFDIRYLPMDPMLHFSPSLCFSSFAFPLHSFVLI